MSSHYRALVACLAVVGVVAILPGGAAATAGDSPAGGTAAPIVAPALEQAEDENASFIHDGDAITLHPGPGQVIKGTTTAPPGTNVTVWLRSADAEAPFLLTERTTVTPDGRFAVSFDLRDVAPPRNATATVLVGGEQVGWSAPVEIVVEPTTTGTTPGPTTTAVTTPEPATDTPEATPTSVPGFGVGLGAVAVVIGLLVRRRGR